MSKRLEIIVANGSLAGKRYKAASAGLRLGRSSSNDIPIPDESLSRNHCLFEETPDRGLLITDLASANGTILNGKDLGSAPAQLKAGDVVEVGETVLHIVYEGDDLPKPKAAPTIDLGFAPKKTIASPEKKRSSKLVNIFLFVVSAVTCAAVYLAIKGPRNLPPVEPVSQTQAQPQLREVYYEKVEATARGIFRYELTLSKEGSLAVQLDDVPDQNRHLKKAHPLSPASLKTLSDILSYERLKTLDDEYAGAEPDTPQLSSQTLKVVYSTKARTIQITNTQEPDAFRDIRSRLEAFSKNELGVWAIQYSKERLLQLAEESLALAKAKYDDREVNYGNLSAAVAAFREGLFYLETIDPKPACHGELKSGLERATAELKRRYEEQRFVANRALNLGQWENAKKELSILIEMIPDRADERNQEAMAKLLDVDKRIKKGAR